MERQNSLNFTLGARLEENFNSTVNQAGKKVNSLRERFTRISNISAKFTLFDNLKSKISNSENALIKNNAELAKAKAALSQTSRPTAALTNQIRMLEQNAARLSASLQADKNQFSALSDELKRAGVNLNNFASERARLLSQRTSLGQTIDKLNNYEGKIDEAKNKRLEAKARLAEMMPLMNMAKSLVQPSIAFEQSMANVKSIINGISNEEMKALEKEAKRLGASTSFSASEAAEGMKFLGMAGFKTNQIIDSMPGLLDLARAGSVELGRASDVASNILSAFGLEAKEMTRVADVMAMTFTTSNTSFEQLAETMAYAAPNAAAAGVSMEKLAAMTGLLGNIGIQGTKAGTALRGMLLRLSAPTGGAVKTLKQLGVRVKDSSGNMLDMVEILKKLAKATAKMGSADKMAAFKSIFGEEPAGAALELINQAGSGGLEDYLNNTIMKNKGKGAAVAKEQMNTAEGAIIELKSATEGAAIAFGQLFLPIIKEATQFITSITQKLNGLIDKFPKLTKFIGGGTFAVIGLTAAIHVGAYIGNTFKLAYYGTCKAILFFTNSSFAAALKTKAMTAAMLIQKGAMVVLSGVMKGVTIAQWALNAAMTANPVGIIVVGIGALIAAGVALYKNWDKVKKFLLGVWEKLKEGFSDCVDYLSGLFAKVLDIVLAPFKAVSDAVQGVKNFFFGDEKITAPLVEPAALIEPAPANKGGVPAGTGGVNSPASIISENAKNGTQAINNNQQTITYSPVVNINGSASAADISRVLSDDRDKFARQQEEYKARQQRLSYVGGY